MTLKKILALLLTGILCLSLCACNGGEGPEMDAQSLAELSDGEIIEILKKNYGEFSPTAVSYDGEMTFRVSDQVIYSSSSLVLINGTNRTSTTTVTVPENTKPVTMTLFDGTWYVESDGQKVKYPQTEADEVEEYPFLFDNLEDFSQNTLLRGEDGFYYLIFHGLTEEKSAFLKDYVNSSLSQEETVTVKGFSDPYVTLTFSSEGKFTGSALGMTYTMSQDGVDTPVEAKIEFRIRSTHAAEVVISLPSDAEAYTTPAEE